MKRTALMLIAIELLLGVKLILKQDAILFFTVLVSQIFIFMVALRFGPHYTVAIDKKTKIKVWILATIVLVVTPVLFLHKGVYELSRWGEVGLYLRGPYAALFFVFGASSAAVVAATSLYLRNKNDIA